MIRQSPSDARIIDDLKTSRERLLSDPLSRELLSGIRRRLNSITRNLYILRWIPEQGEDVYSVLVDGETVVQIEIPRAAQNRETVFQRWSVEEYSKARTAFTKHERRKLELAIQLAKSDE